MSALFPSMIDPVSLGISTLPYSLYPIVQVEGQRKNANHSTRNLAYVKSILIVDDSPVIRGSVRTLLQTQPDWVICGEAENGCDGIEKAAKLRPDLIVIDLAMPVLNGIVATSVLKRLMPAVHIVMFTSFSDPSIKKTAMAAGLDAFVDKSESPETLLSCIEQLLVPKPLRRSVSAA